MNHTFSGLEIRAEPDLNRSLSANHHPVGTNTRVQSAHLISNGSCVSIAVRQKPPEASVSTCLFQVQHDIFQADVRRPPAIERPPFGLKKRKGQRLQLRDNSVPESFKFERFARKEHTHARTLARARKQNRAER